MPAKTEYTAEEVKALLAKPKRAKRTAIAMPSETRDVAAFALPVPPSLNNAFATYRGRRIPSREYKAWRQLAAIQIGKVTSRVQSPVVVFIIIRGGKGFPITSDLDNRIKPVLDLLVSLGVLEGDSIQHVRHVGIEYREPVVTSGAAWCEVEIRRLARGD